MERMPTGFTPGRPGVEKSSSSCPVSIPLDSPANRSGRTLVLVICGLNVLLVGFLMWRVYAPPKPSNPLIREQVQTPPETVDQASQRVRESIRNSGAADEDHPGWVRLFAQHPRVGPDQWSDEIAQTLDVFLETVGEIPDPLARINAREVVFDRFSLPPPALPSLLDHATDVVDSPDAGPAAKRSAIILLFRLLLQNPPEEGRSSSIPDILLVLKSASSDPAFRPILIEGWGVLRARGFEEDAGTLFSVEDLRRILENPQEDPESFLQALVLAETVAPEWEASHYQPWLDHDNPRIAAEAWKQLQRTADASTVEWLGQWNPSDPTLDLRRLQALRNIDQRLSREETPETSSADESGGQ